MRLSNPQARCVYWAALKRENAGLLAERDGYLRLLVAERPDIGEDGWRGRLAKDISRDLQSGDVRQQEVRSERPANGAPDAGE